MYENKMLAKLQEMKQDKKGFTLVELLVVVAIIAVLVAIAIPMFTSSLDKANKETDNANMRSAKAVAVSASLGAVENVTANGTWYFDAASGKLQQNKNGITAYGKAGNATGKVIKVVFTAAANGTTGASYDLSWD